MLTLQAKFVRLVEQRAEGARCRAGFDRQPVGEVDLVEAVGDRRLEAATLARS